MTERVTGLAFQRLVPSTLLPPEDPSRTARRTVRDWVVDVLAFLIVAGIGLLVFASSLDEAVDHVPAWSIAVDLVLGSVSCLLIWVRRSHPVGVGVLTMLFGVVSAFGAPASAVALFTVAVHRRTTVAFALGAANLGASALMVIYRPQKQSWLFSVVVSVVLIALITAWGMFVRARRQLVWTLRARAERAEADQRLQADQARQAERTRIAREMHDVLGHRISLVALHAGGLEMRPDVPAEQVRETAQLLRETARQALEELRGVIGVLRDDEPGPDAPQPTLADIPRLVEETRQAGAKIDFRMAVPDAAPGALGRDAYRIVQEALTNIAKHARGTATTVRVTGAPGEGLCVDIRNRLPVAAGPSLPGGGAGLLGLRERVDLAGGTLRHGPSEEEFIVEAHLPWG